jgi:hypothetical protein
MSLKLQKAFEELGLGYRISIPPWAVESHDEDELSPQQREKLFRNFTRAPFPVAGQQGGDDRG